VTTLEWSTISAVGEDAHSFLDGQLSQRLDGVGSGRWSLLLNPDGVTVTSLWVREGEQGLELLVPTSLASAALARLNRFRLRVRVELSVREGASTAPLVTTDALMDRRWPWTEEFERHLVPHTCGAAFVAETVSFTKGCFTGQELVGRLDARGANVPWRMVVLRGPDLRTIEATLASVGPEGPRGVTRWREREGEIEAVAIAHRTLMDAVHDTVSVRAVA
jgi:folate-binding protein YgfZ